MKKLPNIPKSVFSVLGRIPVTQEAVLPNDDGTPSTDLGWWDGHQRQIHLRADTDHSQKWHTLLHEKVHMWLWDAGVKLPEDAEENLCDVIATALLAEKLNTKPSLP